MTVFSAPSWDFRVRGTFTRTARITLDQYELVLTEAPPARVTLHASSPEVSLKNSDVFILHGTGFESAETARQHGEAWFDYVIIGFAASAIGADFGVRVPLEGGLTEAAFGVMRDAVQAQGHGGVQLSNERSGVQVYETNPPATFYSGSADGFAGNDPEEILAAISEAANGELRLTDSYRLAYDLFSASFLKMPTDAQFMMLSMALETLIDQKARSEEALMHLKILIADTRNAGLSEAESNSIIGGLDELTRRESVGQAGRRLVATLGDKTYGGVNPAKFFSSVYTLRSDLVHGKRSRPDNAIIVEQASSLRQLSAICCRDGLLRPDPSSAISNHGRALDRASSRAVASLELGSRRHT